jgi:hypothetical protein
MTSPTTPQELFAQLLTELSASGDVPLTAATDTVPAAHLTAREAWQNILWVTNACVDMKGTNSPYGPRPFPPSVADTILGHVLSARVESMQTLALVTALCEAAKIDTKSILDAVAASIQEPAPVSVPAKVSEA